MHRRKSSSWRNSFRLLITVLSFEGILESYTVAGRMNTLFTTNVSKKEKKYKQTKHKAAVSAVSVLLSCLLLFFLLLLTKI